jgi:choline dehydrogenase-like flavoprotein
VQTIETDVLVIGTGFGAAAPALRLAESGARVIMIEKGPRVGVGDFRQTQDPRYVTKYIKGLSGDHLSLTYAEALGGGSGFYEMVSLRAPSLAFDQRESTARPSTPGTTWPRRCSASRRSPSKRSRKAAWSSPRS